MKLAVVRYNAGNTQSVKFALQRLGIDPVLTNDPEILRSADKVIFPGVGEASTTMRHLRELGLDEVLPRLQGFQSTGQRPPGCHLLIFTGHQP